MESRGYKPNRGRRLGPAAIAAAALAGAALIGGAGAGTETARLAVASLAAALLVGLALAFAHAARAGASARRQLEAVLAATRQGIVLTDAEGRVELHNPRAPALLGLPEAMLRRKPPIGEILAFQERRGEFEGLSQAGRALAMRRIPSPVPERYERVRPDGTVLDIRTLPLPGGGAVRSYADVTERSKAIADMHASMALANSLVNASPDCIQLLDREGRIGFISDLGQELLEIDDVESVRGRPFASLFPEEHRPRIELALRRVRGGQTDRFTRKCPTLGGVMRWWEFIITPVHEIGRAPERLFVVVRDVSARQAHAEELGRAKEAAERASQAKTRFLAAMSHEMRTPLNAILGFAALARERAGDDPQLRRQIELMHKAGEALLTLIDDLLDLSKIEAGKVELEERPLALRGLVEDCLSLTRGPADRKGLALGCTLDPRLPDGVMADEARLRQILLNLVNNAVKFTKRGHVEISVAPAGDGGGLVFAISDTGIGIAPERLGQLFQDFVQGDGSIARHYGGTGLGLSISRRLARLMGGDIAAASTAGQGSTFTVTLPLAPAPQAAPAAPEAAAPAPGAATPRRILLVDDLAINREIVAAMLAGAGHEVRCADSGPGAIAACRRQRPDLILMDVQMPGMDGLETTRRIRALDGHCRQVPILALTANVFPQQIAAYREAGLDDHLGKPFHRDALLAAVARWTDPARRPQAAAPEGAGKAGAADAVFDAAAQRELAGLIGEETFDDLLARLGQDLPRHFQSAPASATATLRHDAHGLSSTAGLLGFTRLAAAARGLEAAIVEGGDVALALAGVREEHGRAQAAIGALLARRMQRLAA